MPDTQGSTQYGQLPLFNYFIITTQMQLQSDSYRPGRPRS